MQDKLEINFIYKPEHKIYFQELGKRLGEKFQIKSQETDELPDSLDTKLFYILSEEFKDNQQLVNFGHIHNAQVIIRDKEQDYSNLDLSYVIQKFYEVAKMQNDFMELTTQIEREVERLQNWYQRQVPIREEKNEGIYLCSKHKSGSKPGGDFFETIDTGATIQVILTHTNSYILNARILELIMIYKHEREQSIDELVKKFFDIQEKFNDCELSLLLIEVSKRDLSFSGYQFGKNDIYDPSGKFQRTTNEYSLNQHFVNEAKFSGKLAPGSKLMLSSKGALLNWQKKLALKEYYQMLSGALEPKKDLEKVILKLYEEDSLEYDTSIILMEVNSHGIYEA